MITYAVLPQDDLDRYAVLLPAGQAHLLRQVGADYLKHVVIGASADETVLGVVIVRLNRVIRRAFLFYIATLAERRREGIGSRLLTEMRSALQQRGIQQLQASYTIESDRPAPVEGLLVRAGWRAPQTNHVLMSWQFDTADAGLMARYWQQTAAGRMGRDFPDGGEVFSWTEGLRQADREVLAAYLDEFPVELSSLYPSYDGDHLFPTSLGLRLDGRLAGWLIIHERPGQALRFTMLFLHPNFRGRRLGLKLINEGVARAYGLCQARSAASGDPIWEWQAQSVPQNQLMLAFYDLTGPLATRRQELRVAVQDI